MKFVLRFFLLSLVFFSCKTEDSNDLQLGVWRAELQLTPDEALPFIFEVTSAQSLKIFNAEEVILVNDITYSNDTIVFKTPVFDGFVEAVINKGSLKGNFIKEDLGRVVPFTAEFGNSKRFASETNTTNQNVAGNWEVVFSPNIEAETYMAKGIFKQDGVNVTGTFRTTTGDYRYLEGLIDGNTMRLSTFDGAHAFLFTAEINGDTMDGKFYSGSHWEEPFVAKRSESYELPNANDLTFLKEGYETLEFKFPDADGNMVSLSDYRFKNKAVVVQVMGTWCPNCLDESKYYSEYYNTRSSKDVEFVALAFEYAKTKEKAFENIKRLKDDIGISYPILLAQYGTSDKDEAQERLPMLNHVLSYPTTIFIDKKGNVCKIHTGFNGPATGDKYTDFKTEFTSFVDALVSN
ncbi:peroxiredoxin family protein [Psychroserpens ponticola]|uniref:TlpA disulfide reductase family protein n=1 Tax=Psychroserpens ponticola TaxID=2932268 RepID=A0ABY7S1P2_9FLAO|nr:TlpA disulfide reductase family protein [Psychroserpens ponticola]WCO02927.1 TlpA disulfide reductase family protein [Psychroserpens ponticola]